MIYHGLQGHIYSFLQRNVWARERRNKDKAIVLALYERNYGYPKNPQQLVEFVQDYNSADRYWRLLTSAHPELRGQDYDTKQIVEQRKVLNLGYEPGYHEVNRRLETV